MRRLFEDPQSPTELRDDLLRSREAGHEYPIADKLVPLRAALEDPTRDPLAQSGQGAVAVRQLTWRALHPGWKLAALLALGGAAALLLRPELSSTVLNAPPNEAKLAPPPQAAAVTLPPTAAEELSPSHAAELTLPPGAPGVAPPPRAAETAPSHAAELAPPPGAPGVVAPPRAATSPRASDAAPPRAVDVALQPRTAEAAPPPHGAELALLPGAPGVAPPPRAAGNAPLWAAEGAVAVDDERGSAADEQGTSSRREIAQLVRIRALLQQEPQAAYRLAQRSEREFPRGLLSEERQALAIVALHRTGKRAVATAQARAFFERFPESPMRELIDAELNRARK